MTSPSCRWMCLPFGIRYSTRLRVLLVRLDDDPALVLVVLAEAHRAGDLGDDRVILRPARLEQLRHPRQTAGDVAGLGAFGRDTRETSPAFTLRARLDREDGVDREQVAGIAAARELEDLAVLALDHDRRPQVAPRGSSAPVDDHALGDAGRLRRASPTSTDLRPGPRSRPCLRPRSGSAGCRDPTRRCAGRA